MRRVLDDSGTETAAFSDFADGDGRRELERVCQEAEELGVFGVPSFVIDGEIFWGGDRIWMVREKLAELAARR